MIEVQNIMVKLEDMEQIIHQNSSQVSSLDIRLDGVKAKIWVHKDQADKIQVYVDRHDDLLVVQRSHIKDYLSSREFDGSYVHQPNTIVNISRSENYEDNEADLEENPRDNERDQRYEQCMQFQLFFQLFYALFVGILVLGQFIRIYSSVIVIGLSELST